MGQSPREAGLAGSVPRCRAVGAAGWCLSGLSRAAGREAALHREQVTLSDPFMLVTIILGPRSQQKDFVQIPGGLIGGGLKDTRILAIPKCPSIAGGGLTPSTPSVGAWLLAFRGWQRAPGELLQKQRKIQQLW